MPKTQLAPGWIPSAGEKLRDVKRPACSERRTVACRSCVTAVCQPYRRRAEPAEATGALRPACRERCASTSSPCPTERLSTPPVRPVFTDRGDQPHPLNGAQRVKDQRQTATAGLDRGRRPLRQLRLFGPRWLRRTNVKLRIASIPSWAKPVQQGSRTQVSVVGNLGESLTVQQLSPIRAAEKTPCVPPPRKLLQIGHGQHSALPSGYSRRHLRVRKWTAF